MIFDQIPDFSWTCPLEIHLESFRFASGAIFWKKYLQWYLVFEEMATDKKELADENLLQNAGYFYVHITVVVVVVAVVILGEGKDFGK